MAIKYKHKCARCRKNYVVITYRTRYPLCYDCQKGEMVGEIKDPKMKKMFNIPEKFYRESTFLRSIKINYLRFGKLSERQIETFKKAVKTMKDEEKS
ncbi:MAG: hypothetical protein KAT77_00750 [Nanoarchaeota archaeon]|nr:hypothetical protein [Nanoarchaeota archaeon]